LLGTAIGELTLRVAGGEHEGRELAVRSPKCTIGSAPGCTVRLAARGVRPLHCWILRGPGGTIVRSRDAHTRLNGRPFSDAPLAPGDRLRVGSVELDIVACPTVPASWSVESSALPDFPPAIDFDPLVAEEAKRQAEQTATQLRDELHSLERRAAEQLGELNAQVTGVTAQRDEISARLGRLEAETAAERSELLDRLRSAENIAAGERAQLASRIQAMEAEAASERDALRQEKERLELSLASTEQTLAEQRSHLSSREAEIESILHIESRRVAEIQSRLEQVVRERAELQARLNKERASLQADVQTHQAAVDRVQGECDRLEAELAKLRENVGYTAAERDNLTVRLNQVHQEQGSQHQHLAAERDQLQQKLDAALAQLADAQRQLAVQQVEGGHRQTEIALASTLQQKLDQAEAEKSELARRLAEQTAAWHAERESLRQQTERVTSHCEQVEGQLVHVRELVESLASDRDSICQQLEAAEMRLEAEKQAWQAQQQSLEQQLQNHAASDRDLKLAELTAQLERETQRGNQWTHRAQETESRLAAAGQKLAEAEERFAALQSASEDRLRCELSRAELLAQEADKLRLQLSVTQVALADSETRLAALQSSSEHQLNFERGRAEAAEQRSAELSRDLAASDLRLAEAERRLSAYRIEGDARLNAETQKCLEQERQVREAAAMCESLRNQLVESQAKAAAMETELGALDAAQQHTRSASAERWQQLQAQLERHESQLSALRSDYEARMQVQVDLVEEARRRLGEQQAAANEQYAQWERRLADADAARAELEARLAEQVERLRAERESWQVELQRQSEARESLERQLIENQRRLAEMTEQASPASDAPRDNQMTVTIAELNEAQAQEDSSQEALPSADERATWDAERATWDADRKQLEERIAGLEQTLADPTHISQTMTLTGDALAELQSPGASEQANERIAELETRLNALKDELAQAVPWQDRCREALAAADEARTRAEGLAAQVTDLQSRLELQAAAPPPDSLSMTIAANPICGQGDESPALDEQQNIALADERRSLAEERALLEAARGELANERDAFERSQNELEAKSRAWEEALGEKEKLLQEQAAELTDHLERAALRAAELEQERTQLAAQQAELPVQLDRPAVNETSVEPIQPLTGSAAGENTNRSEDRPATAEPNSGTASSQAIAEAIAEPAAPAEAMPEDKPQVTEVAVRRSSSLTNRPKPVWTQPDQPAPRADDDSIEAYMARLLMRVRGDSPPAETKRTPAAPSASPLPSANPGTSAVQDQVRSVSATVPHSPDTNPPEKPEDFMPRNRPPELSTNLATMRQVANTVARTAIVKHQQKNGSERALAQSVGAGLTFVCTTIAALIAYRTESLLGGIAAAAGAMATCYWGGRALGHALRAMRLRIPTGETLVLPMGARTIGPAESDEPVELPSLFGPNPPAEVDSSAIRVESAGGTQAGAHDRDATQVNDQAADAGR
jgi:chromosome segregation ATPase